MVLSRYRSAILDAPPPKPQPDAPLLPDRPRGARRSHIPATVREVRHLVETTLMTYAEIAQRTGVALGNIWRWASNGNWMRPAFAPRSTRTVPTWRAGRQRRRRMLAVRCLALAERYVRALEAAPALDAARLREARALLSMAKLATEPQTPRARLLRAVRPVADLKPPARVAADPPANGRDIGGTPGKRVAQKRAARHCVAPDRAVEGMIEDVRQDAGPRPPHPAAIRREDVPLPQRK